MADKYVVQHHATMIKWYGETLLEENPLMRISDAMESAIRQYKWIGVHPGDVEIIKRCVRSFDYSDLSHKTRVKMAADLKPYSRNWFERFCVWLQPYL